MRFSWNESMSIVLICFLPLLIQVAGAAAADICINSTMASSPDQVKLLRLTFPRFIDREASPFFLGHRITRNGKYFAFIKNGSSNGQCLFDVVDVALKQFCLLRAEFSKVNNRHLMLQISSPNINDSGCYAVHWMFKNVESKDPERIFLEVNKASPTTQSTTTISSSIKDNVSQKVSSPSLAPTAASDASYSAMKQTLYLCCLLLVTIF